MKCSKKYILSCSSPNFHVEKLKSMVASKEISNLLYTLHFKSACLKHSCLHAIIKILQELKKNKNKN